MRKLHSIEEKGLLMQSHAINIKKLPKRIKYNVSNKIFLHAKPNIWAEFERNWRFELNHRLPGFAWFSHGHTLNMLSKCDVLFYLHIPQTLGSCCIDLPDIQSFSRNSASN